MKVLVAGATGETGRRIVRELVARGIAVRALVRDLDRAAAILPAEAELVRGDVTQPQTLAAAFQDCTDVICATGARPSWDPSGPFVVDNLGTCRLVDLAKAQGMERFVLVSSLCVSLWFHPLNLFWLVLIWKKFAEDYLRQSGLGYTIIRPGGLRNEDNADAVVMSGADTLFDGSISRTKVAEIAVEALFQPTARDRILEVIAKPDAPARSLQQLFGEA